MLALLTRTGPACSVRVVRVSCKSAEISSPRNGVHVSNLDHHVDEGAVMKQIRYQQSGQNFPRERVRAGYSDEGIISVSLMPGALKSDLNRHMPKLVQLLLLWTLQKDAIFGAYTEAFAGLSPEVDEGRKWSLYCSLGTFL